MKNALKLIIDAIRIATDKIINKIPRKLSELEIDTELGVKSWNDLEDKPFSEEQTITSIEGLEYIVCPKVVSSGSYFPHDFIIPLEVGQKYNVYYQNHDVLYDTCEVKIGTDGICYLGASDFSDYPFYITPTVTRLHSSWVSAMGVNRVKIVGVSGVITGEPTIHHLDPKFIKDMYYEEPEKWIKVEIVDDNWSGRATCKLSSTPIEWAEDNSYKIRVDGVEYTFTGMLMYGATNNTENKDIYYIGADWKLRNDTMDFTTCPFCFLTTDFTNIYVVFEDATMNHTVEFFASEAKINYLDPKFIKDMYYEKDSSILLPIVTSDIGYAKGYTDYKVKIPYILEIDKPISLRVDGAVYKFDSFICDGNENSLGTAKYRIGAPFRGGTITDSSEYPFTILVFYDGDSGYRETEYAHIEFADETPNHTVEILGEIEIHKIDKKYLPDDIGGSSVFTVNITTNEDGSLSADKTFEEISIAIDETIDDQKPMPQACFMGFVLNLLKASDPIIFSKTLWNPYNDDGIMEYDSISIGINSDNSIEFIAKDGDIANLEALEGILGDNSSLNTTDKTLVGAINEVNEKVAGSNGEQVQIQADWNQNDETANDYIKNKPFYVKQDEILPNTTITSEMYLADFQGYLIQHNIELIEGETYVVNYNGTEYECECIKLPYSLGNTSVMVDFLGNNGVFTGADTGHPFLLVDATPVLGAGIGFMPIPDYNPGMDTSTTWEISIKTKEEIKHIDSKFIKDMYYSEEKESVVYEEKETKTGTASSPAFTTSFGFEEGKTYKVTWNGTKYVCEAFKATMQGLEGVGVGNKMAVGGDNTGEPFVIADVVGIGTGAVIDLTASSEGTVTLGIMCNEEIVHKIDTKYIDAEWMATKTEGIVDTTLPPEFIKDMYYDDTKVLLPKSILAPNDTDTLYIGFPMLGLIEGEKYIVTYNRKRYELVGRVETEGSYNGFVCLGGFDGYDFKVIDHPKDNTYPTGCHIIYTEQHTDSGFESFEIEIVKEDIHTIESKYIKDMYYDNTKTIFPMSTLPYNDAYNIYVNTDTLLNLTVGDKYTVIFNGVKYDNLVAYQEDTGGVLLGGESFRYPFTIEDFSMLGSMFNVVYHESTNSETEFTLEIIKEDLHTIDPKYIDDMYYDRKKIILPKSKLTCNDTNTIYMSPAGNPLGLELDEKYDVTFNGAKYECIAYANASGNSTINAILGGNEYPFEIIEWTSAHRNNASFSVICNGISIESGTLYVFEIEITKRELRKIDNKFIDADWIAKKEENVTVLLPEVVIEDIIGNYSSGEDYYSFTFNNDNLNFTITKGKEYIVNFDGVDYVCEVQVAHSDLLDVDFTYIGNPFLAQTIDAEDNGMPFIFDHTKITNDSATISSMTIPKNVSHTVKFSVTEVERIIEPLPQEFLPEIPKFDLTEMGLPTISMDGIDVTVECDTTEVIKALEKGNVKLKANASFNGHTIPVSFVGSPYFNGATGSYCVSGIIPNVDFNIFAHMIFTNHDIVARCNMVATRDLKGDEIPVFNLVEMGLPSVPGDGTPVEIEADTAELIQALNKGIVDVTYMFDFEMEDSGGNLEITSRLVTNYINSDGAYYHFGSVKIDLFDVSTSISFAIDGEGYISAIQRNHKDAEEVSY